MTDIASEDDLIATYFAPIAGAAGLGLRDDAAVFTPASGCDIVVTTDAVVAGVHFFAEDAAGDIARKSLRVNLSDLAAKGASPLGFVLSLALPHEVNSEWLTAFAEGLRADAQEFAMPLVGGDTVKTPGPLTISVTAFGALPQGRMVARTGVKPGDWLYVSGTIGDAALGLRLRLGERSDASWRDRLAPATKDFLIGRYLLPQPRMALAACLLSEANGAMDVSDGLVGDLTKMLKVSGVGANVRLDRLPLSMAARAAVAIEPGLFETAVTGGDDYEILCSVPPARAAAFETGAAAAGIAVTRIGVAHPGKGNAPVFIGGDGKGRDFAQGSYSHF
jgi:thiamine-monophosphate kinase